MKYLKCDKLAEGYLKELYPELFEYNRGEKLSMRTNR